MPKRKPEPDHDANQEAARIVREATAGKDALPAGLEAAWAAWSKGIKGVDERAWTLLRAAFEAGAATSPATSAAALGRRGGLKGGKARAAKLSAGDRSAIARKAARARWRPYRG